MIKDKKIIHNKDIAAPLDPDPGMVMNLNGFIW
jgi:hypothetical protein